MYEARYEYDIPYITKTNFTPDIVTAKIVKRHGEPLSDQLSNCVIYFVNKVSIWKIGR